MVKQVKSEIQIDVVAECTCCSFEGLDWSSFLEHFDSDTHRPQPGKPVPLVIRFRGSTARGPKGKADKTIRRIQQRIAEGGNARLLDGVYQSTGFFSHACGHGH